MSKRKAKRAKPVAPAKPSKPAKKAKRAKPRATPRAKTRATPRPASRTAASKLDLYKEFAGEYVTPAEPVFVHVGRAHYLSIEGEGDPDSVVFSDAVGALYAVSFTVKMARKFAGTDYVVSKLEALWWVNLPDADLMATPRGRWHWKLMIRIPEFITSAEIVAAIKDLVARDKPHSVKYVRRISVTEGKCVQMLHVGPYTEEPVSIDRMRTFAGVHGWRFQGTHHEIYLSDPRRVPAERLRTILRQPVGFIR